MYFLHMRGPEQNPNKLFVFIYVYIIVCMYCILRVNLSHLLAIFPHHYHEFIHQFDDWSSFIFFVFWVQNFHFFCFLVFVCSWGKLLHQFKTKHHHESPPNLMEIRSIFLSRVYLNHILKSNCLKAHHNSQVTGWKQS